MSKLRHHGMFPTPYGVEVPACHPDPIDSADPDRVLFSMDTLFARSLTLALCEPERLGRRS